MTVNLDKPFTKQLDKKVVEWRKLADMFYALPLSPEPATRPFCGDLMLKYGPNGCQVTFFVDGKALPLDSGRHSITLFAPTEEELWRKAVKEAEQFRLDSVKYKTAKTKTKK